MGRRREVSYYNDEFAELTEQVVLQRREWTIKCESRKLAEKLRGQYYAFVGAGYRLRDRVEQVRYQRAAEAKKFGAPVTDLTPEMLRQAEIAGWTIKVHAIIRRAADGKLFDRGEEGPALLKFMHRDDGELAQLLRSGIVAASPRRQELDRELAEGLQSIPTPLEGAGAGPGKDGTAGAPYITPLREDMPQDLQDRLKSYGFRGARGPRRSEEKK